MVDRKPRAGVGDNLREVAESDAANLGFTIHAVGSLWSLADNAQGLYGELATALTMELDPPDPKKGDAVLSAPAFLLAAQRSALLGLLQHGRLHFQEGDMLARRCLELAAFAWMVWKDSSLMRSWA